MIVSLQSLTLNCNARVFSLKNLLTISWIMWAYIVCVKKWGKHSLKSCKQRVSWVTRELAKPRSDLRKPTWHKSMQLPSMCFSCGLLRVVHLRASRELVTNFTKLTYSTLTLNPTNKQGNYWTKYNQIWHETKANKNTVVNHNFTQIIKSISISGGK